MTIQKLSKSPALSQHRSGLLAKITVEHIAYAAILLVAAILRFADLGLVPLNPDESVEALALWRLWQAGAGPAVPISPAFFALTMPLTQLLGFSDAVVRLVPALFGLALVLTPWFIRHRTGRLGALIAALLLALSPSNALLSRTANGQTIALFAGTLLFISWLRYHERGGRRWLYALAGALALGLASATLFYAFLLTLAIAWLAQSVIGPALIQDDDGQRASMVRPSRRELGNALIIGSVTFLLLATSGFLALRGLGSAADLIADWIRHFQLVATASLRVTPFLLAGKHEIVLLILGIPAIIWAAFGERPFPTFCVYWVIAALLMLLLQPGSAAVVLLLTLPGYLLIGRFANDILLRASSLWWLALLAGVVVGGGIIYLNLVRFARLAGQQGAVSSTYHLLIAFITLMVIAIVAVLAWTWDRSAATKGVLAGILVLLSIVQWGNAWWFTHQGANDTRERWVESATDDDIRLVVQSIEELSWRASNSADDVSIDAAVDTPILRWYLRDFSNVTFAESLPSSTNSPLLLTPADYSPQIAGSYLGTDFGYSRLDTIHNLGWIDALRWWLFRQSPIPVNEQRLILWLRADLAETSQ